MTSLDWGSRASLGPGLGGSGLILADRKDKNRTTEALRSILGLQPPGESHQGTAGTVTTTSCSARRSWKSLRLPLVSVSFSAKWK